MKDHLYNINTHNTLYMYVHILSAYDEYSGMIQGYGDLCKRANMSFKRERINVQLLKIMAGTCIICGKTNDDKLLFQDHCSSCMP